MSATEYRDKSAEELQTLVSGLLEERFKLRFQAGVDKAVKTHEYERIRKNIARIKTVMNEKQRGQVK